MNLSSYSNNKGLSLLEIIISIFIISSSLTLSLPRTKLSILLNKTYQEKTSSQINLELAKQHVLRAIKSAKAYHSLDSINFSEESEILVFTTLRPELKTLLGITDCYKIYTEQSILRRKSLCKKENQPLVYGIKQIKIEQIKKELYQISIQDTERNKISFTQFIKKPNPYAWLNLMY